jgi:hypothetical protein
VALAVPALLLAIVLYLVLRSIRGVHHQLEKTISQVFLGEAPVPESDVITYQAVRQPLARRIAHRIRRLASRVRKNRLERHTKPGKSDGPTQNGE